MGFRRSLTGKMELYPSSSSSSLNSSNNSSLSSSSSSRIGSSNSSSLNSSNTLPLNNSSNRLPQDSYREPTRLLWLNKRPPCRIASISSPVLTFQTSVSEVNTL